MTGAAALVADVVPALEKEGFATHSAPTDALHILEGIRHAGLRTRSLDCYVQLPTTDHDRGEAASLAGLRALVVNALLARFDALAVVAPLLAPGARLVIVAGDRAGTTSDIDLGLPEISGVLAEAVLACHGADDIRPTVIRDTFSTAEIAGVARGQANGAALVGYAAVSPELSYVDWRDEVLGLVAEMSGGTRGPASRITPRVKSVQQRGGVLEMLRNVSSGTTESGYPI